MARATASRPGALAEPSAAAHTGFGLGFLAMLPLFASYELAQWALDGRGRNAAEMLFGLGYQGLGQHARSVRWIVLLALGLGAFASVRASGLRLWNAGARVVVEGLLGAITLGPLLLWSLRLLWPPAAELELSWEPSRLDPGATTAGTPSLAQGALLFGGAAWEELVFRLGLFSAIAFLVRSVARSAGATRGWQLALAELPALALSAAAFALFHLQPVQCLVAPAARAESDVRVDPALLAWLFAAGLALALLFRLRGVGVAAWTHGLFNLALWVGVDPQVLR